MQTQQFSKEERIEYNRYRAGVCQALGIREQDYNKFRRIKKDLQELSSKCQPGEETLSEQDYDEQTTALYTKGEELAHSLGLVIWYDTFFVGKEGKEGLSLGIDSPEKEPSSHQIY